MENSYLKIIRSFEISNVFRKVSININGNISNIDSNHEKIHELKTGINEIYVFSGHLKSRVYRFEIKKGEDKKVKITSRFNNYIVIIETIVLAVLLICGSYSYFIQKVFWLWLAFYSFTPLFYLIVKRKDYFLIKE